jgi:hypothetical protein
MINTKKFSRCSQSPRRILNPGPPEYDKGMIITPLWRCVTSYIRINKIYLRNNINSETIRWSGVKACSHQASNQPTNRSTYLRIVRLHWHVWRGHWPVTTLHIHWYTKRNAKCSSERKSGRKWRCLSLSLSLSDRKMQFLVPAVRELFL